MSNNETLPTKSQTVPTLPKLTELATITVVNSKSHQDFKPSNPNNEITNHVPHTHPKHKSPKKEDDEDEFSVKRFTMKDRCVAWANVFLFSRFLFRPFYYYANWQCFHYRVDCERCEKLSK